MASGRTFWEELVWRYQHGIEQVHGMLDAWQAVQPHIDPQRHADVLQKLTAQVADAAEWPQVCVPYFQQFSHLPITR